MLSEHCRVERHARHEFISSQIGFGNVIQSFLIPRGSSGFAEQHSVTDKAIIIIQNPDTHKVITELIARPAQLKRLYKQHGGTPPPWLLKQAYKNNQLRYNNR